MTYGGSLTDLEAVRAFAASRDPRAFEVLLERYQRMVLATCLRVLGDRGHAEDATQETFLKLARHAGEITSNAGAWLHRCATRTAIDAQRSLRVRREAEAVAGRAAASERVSGDPAERTWKEIEPLVDAALERLRDEDRDVLVSRFLLGRSQSAMADDAGVNAGTMSRRIDKALKRLHAELGKGGVQIAGVGVLGGAMVLAAKGAAGAVVPTAETIASLGKIGLAAGAGSKSGSKALVLVTAAVLGIGAVTGAAVLAGGKSARSAGALGVVPTAAAGDPVERPGRKAIEGLELVHHQVNGPMGPTMECDGQKLEMSMPSWNGETERMVFRVVDWDRDREDRGTVTLQTRSLDLREGSDLVALRGRTFEADWSFDSADRLSLGVELIEGDSDSRIVWTGVGLGGQEDRDSGRPFVGEWAELSDWSLNVTKDIIEVMSGRHAVYRFKVLDWDERSGVTRVQSICVDSMAPQLVGKRVKLLLRESDGLYELSFRQWPRDRVDVWPEGFVANEENALNVLGFRRVK
ncbi:MAG: sigma-70 family RNA polymerase sigma factor [Planctomycetota bacterium]